MEIELDPQVARFIEEKVKAGAYSSASAAINDVLAAARAQEEWTPEDVAELRAMVAVGAAQADRGELEAWDPVEFKRRLREQLARAKAS